MRCSGCGDEKDVSEFYKNGVDAFGNTRYNTHCKQCFSENKEKRKWRYADGDAERINSECYRCKYDSYDWCDAHRWENVRFPCMPELAGEVVEWMNCEYCGKVIPREHWSRKYCDDRCKRAAHKARQMEAVYGR